MSYMDKNALLKKIRTRQAEAYTNMESVKKLPLKVLQGKVKEVEMRQFLDDLSRDKRSQSISSEFFYKS